jgi:hypothetical protein
VGRESAEVTVCAVAQLSWHSARCRGPAARALAASGPRSTPPSRTATSATSPSPLRARILRGLSLAAFLLWSLLTALTTFDHFSATF